MGENVLQSQVVIDFHGHLVHLLYMFVRRLIQGEKCANIKFVLGNLSYLRRAEEVPRCEDPRHHNLHACLGDRPVLDVLYMYAVRFAP